MAGVLKTVRWLTLGAALGLGAAWAVHLWSPRDAARSVSAAAIGGPFELLDQTGRTRTQTDLAGKYALIYFGFIYCPDACPTALLAMAEALDQLGPLADKIQPVFVSVDPERDTVAEMAAYIDAVDPRFWGLTGSPEQVAKAAKAYRVFYRKVTPPGSAEYLVDHTSLVYVMGPNGAYRAHFTHETPPERMAQILRTLLDR